jgi:2',3'-cyclic-nucleotide 2'-phosphodiesterase (5'-nucleotidase family)
MRGRQSTRSARRSTEGQSLLRRLVRFVLRFALLPAITLGMAACQGCRSSSAPVAAAPSPPSEVGAPSLRLYLVTDLAGALEPCGCTKDQLGGVDHFGAWIRRNGGGAAAAWVASAGPLFFMDTALDSERADQDRTKAETIARVLHGLDLAAFAPGSNDWADGPAALTKLATETGGVAIVPTRAASAPSPPFASVTVREVGAVKVGFVGYGQPEQPPAGATSVEDAVKNGVEEARRQGANVVIALAAVGRGEAKRIADAVPDLTAIVVGSAKANGDSNTTTPQGERVGNVLIVQAANHLQSVAVVDLYVREPIAAGRLLKFADATGLELARDREDVTRRIDDLHDKISAWQRDKGVSASDLDARRRDLAALEAQRDTLDKKPPPATGSFFRYAIKEIRESLGKDPAIEAEMSSYYKAVDEHNRVAFAGRLPAAAGPDEAHYVGVDVCSGCHSGPRKVYDSTSHARAYATLSSQFKEYNLECVGCHVTGYEKPGGSTVTHVEHLENVQCEVCHGPGSRHVANPADASRIVASPGPSTCLVCHHPPHVERFDAVAKMKEILGPGHGMAKE